MMKLTSIREAGSNAILKWAIENGVNIKNDTKLHGIINGDLGYVASISGVNFFELFKLTEIFRDQLLIKESESVAIPSSNELNELFRGVYESEPANDQNHIIDDALNKFFGITLQLESDSNIMSLDAASLYLPMITRTFSIEIPISFSTFTDMLKPDEADYVFSKVYPATLESLMQKEEFMFRHSFQLLLLQQTCPSIYSQTLEKYLEAFIYWPIKSYNNKNTLYKFGLRGFRRDNQHEHLGFSMFKATPDALSEKLSEFIDTSQGLSIFSHADFSIQLPIAFMQQLLNAYPDNVLHISFTSSIASILSIGMPYQAYNLPDLDENHFSNDIGIYSERLADADKTTCAAIKKTLNPNTDNDVAAALALLPSIYSTRASLTIDIDSFDINKIKDRPVIYPMMKKMSTLLEKMSQS